MLSSDTVAKEKMMRLLPRTSFRQPLPWAHEQKTGFALNGTKPTKICFQTLVYFDRQELKKGKKSKYESAVILKCALLVYKKIVKKPQAVTMTFLFQVCKYHLFH